MNKLINYLIIGLMVVGSCLSIQATPIEYIFNGTASGTLDGTSFTGNQFQIYFFGDTSEVDNDLGPFAVGIKSNDLGISLKIFGVGSDTILNNTLYYPYYVFDSHYNQSVGFGQQNLGQILSLGIGVSGSTYGMNTPLGPITGPLNYGRLNFNLATGNGSVSFTSFSSQITFQALVPAPEPSTNLLGAVGLLALIFNRSKRFN